MAKTTTTRGAAPAWLAAALDYIPDWIDFQVERYRQVGCSVAIVHRGALAGAFAAGVADVRTRKRLTPRHRFRIASHSKTFTAAGILLLREQGRLGLDDPVGRHVGGLHRDLAQARLADLLSHGAGVTRDGADSGQFTDRRPYLTREELLAELAQPQPFEPGVSFKYSNHGYGLLGLVIEAVTGTAYDDWMARHVIAAAGLSETTPDMPAQPRFRFPSGHTAEHPFGERLVIPGDNRCNAIAAAGGYVATAADTARFFAQLSPEAKESILSPASRREMVRRRLRDGYNPVEMHYGLGTMMAGAGTKEWIGHTGSLQGFLSRTARFPALDDITVSVTCNALDGLSYAWVDGIASILAAFQEHGAPAKRVAGWRGRWWSLWGANDLVPMGEVVCQVAPAMLPPFDGAPSLLRVTGKDRGLVHKTSGFNSPGQPVRLVRDGKGRPKELWVGGSQLVPREALVKEARGRYR